MERKYVAFISYRHKPLDKAVATRLHQLIERYHVGSAVQPGRKKLGIAFRDQEELPVSGDLGQDIRTALDNSEYLVVVCTPDTPESRWVQEEIRYFRSRHDKDHVLAVLADGEPDEAFPFPLTHPDPEDPELVVEPLAADIRGTGTKDVLKKLNTEKLRLFACFLGVPYDSLARREHKRKQKRLAAVFSVSLAVLLGYAGILLVSNRKISDKNVQLNDANTRIRAQNDELEQANDRIVKQNEQLEDANQKISAQKDSIEQQLALTYLRSGTEQALSGDQEAALLYFAESLIHNPEDQTAQRLMHLLTQKYGWICLKEAQAAPETVESAAAEPEGKLIGEGRDYRATSDGSTIRVYWISEGRTLSVPVPEWENPYCRNSPDKDADPAVVFYHGEDTVRVIFNYAGYLYLYDFEGEAIADSSIYTMESVLGYGEGDAVRNLPYVCPMIISESGKLLLVNGNGRISALDSEKVYRLAVHAPEHESYVAMAVKRDGTGYALMVYTGTDVGGGSEARLYDRDGKLTGTTENDKKYAPLMLSFSPDDSRLLVSRSGALEIVDGVSGDIICPSYKLDFQAVRAEYREDGGILAQGSKGETRLYDVRTFPAEADDSLPARYEEVLENSRISSEAVPEETQEALGRDFKNDPVRHFSGHTVVLDQEENAAPCLLVIGKDGVISDSAAVSEGTGYQYNIIACFEDETLLTVYLGFDRTDTVLRAVIDGESGKIRQIDPISTDGSMVLTPGYAFKDGWCVIQTVAYQLLVFGPEDTVPRYLFDVGAYVSDVDFSADGLLLVETEAAGKATGSRISLWDTRLGCCLMEVAASSDRPLLDPRFVGDDICWVKGTRNRTDNVFQSVNIAAQKLSPEELEDLIGLCCYDFSEEEQRISVNKR